MGLVKGKPEGALAPSKTTLPLSFEGEGDTGGEVEKPLNH